MMLVMTMTLMIVYQMNGDDHSYHGNNIALKSMMITAMAMPRLMTMLRYLDDGTDNGDYEKTTVNMITTTMAVMMLAVKITTTTTTPTTTKTPSPTITTTNMPKSMMTILSMSGTHQHLGVFHRRPPEGVEAVGPWHLLVLEVHQRRMHQIARCPSACLTGEVAHTFL